MKNLKTIIIFLTTTIVISCRGHEEITYHENGNVKFKVYTESGLRKGKAKEYYKSGDIKSEAHWDKGKLEGPAVYYYKNGVIKSIVNWKENQLYGEAKYFYPTSQIKSKCNYLNDSTMIGESVHYSQSGDIVERNIYNEDGELIYIAGYSDTDKSKGRVLPIIYPDKKLVGTNESYSGKIKFGYDITGKISVELGHIDSTYIFVKDTVIKNNGNGEYFFKVRPKKIGENTMSIRIKHDTKDTLSADGIIIKHVFHATAPDPSKSSTPE